MQNSHVAPLITRGTIVLIAIVQAALGIVFLFFPEAFSAATGLPSAPAWTDWIFAMFGARAIGFAFGMVVASRDTRRHATWLLAMIAVQALDWIATMLSVFAGKVTLVQVSTASFLPVLFVAVLAAELLRQRAIEARRRNG